MNLVFILSRLWNRSSGICPQHYNAKPFTPWFISRLFTP